MTPMAHPTLGFHGPRPVSTQKNKSKASLTFQNRAWDLDRAFFRGQTCFPLGWDIFLSEPHLEDRARVVLLDLQAGTPVAPDRVLPLVSSLTMGS